MNSSSSTSFAESYSALTVVSPMMDGDEKKDQDRARWYGPDQVGCVCDGVTSSPNSTDAAILATLFAPALFNGDCKNRLGMLSDLLMARRRECQASDISFDDDTSPAMRDMLRRVAKQKRAISFQTTLVAARFVNRKKVVLAQVCKCGDSAFFAFSPQGQLLTSSLAFPSNLRDQKDKTK